MRGFSHFSLTIPTRPIQGPKRRSPGILSPGKTTHICPRKRPRKAIGKEMAVCAMPAIYAITQGGILTQPNREAFEPWAVGCSPARP